MKCPRVTNYLRVLGWDLPGDIRNSLAAERFDALKKFNYLRYPIYLEALEKLNLKLKKTIAILVYALIQTNTNHLIVVRSEHMRTYYFVLNLIGIWGQPQECQLSILEHRRAFYVPEAIFGFNTIPIRTYSLHDGSAVEWSLEDCLGLCQKFSKIIWKWTCYKTVICLNFNNNKQWFHIFILVFPIPESLASYVEFVL